MHRVNSSGNTAIAGRSRKERRVTYLVHADNSSKHCSGINALKLATLPSDKGSGGDDVLFSGSRDGTIRLWDLSSTNYATCTTTFESHIDWVNDVVIVGEDTLLSCSSDKSIKAWRAFGDGSCLHTFHTHSDYVTSLAAARQKPVLASAGLGCEVFLWDVETALASIARAPRDATQDSPGRRSNLRAPSTQGALNPGGATSSAGERTSSGGSSAGGAPGERVPESSYGAVLLKGHKESVYALAMNDAGTILASGGTEKAVRVWDVRSSSKQMKLRGHTDNIRALILDPQGRYCLSASSDSIIRLWDLGQQRCVHSYAVHTDSVWALAADSSFQRVYSGGRDACVYVTDLHSRESVLLAAEQHPVLRMALQGPSGRESLWVATTSSTLHCWPARVTLNGSMDRERLRKSSFVAGSLGLARVRASMDTATAPVRLYEKMEATIPGIPGIIQHTVLNDKRHVLTKDAENSVKLWEITRGAVVEDFGQVSFEEKEKELFQKVSVASWFTLDSRLGALSVHLDTPHCFAAEMYTTDLGNTDAPEESKLNLGQQTLRGLFAPWIMRRRLVGDSQFLNTEQFHAPSNGVQAEGSGGDAPSPSGRMSADDVSSGEDLLPKNLTSFVFSETNPPSLITEGTHGGPWRRKVVEMDGREDEKVLPWWCIDCVLYSRLPERDQIGAKCTFFLTAHPTTSLDAVAQGKLSAPRILRIQKVMNYVMQHLGIEKPVEEEEGEEGKSKKEEANGDAHAPVHLSRPRVEILCNDEVLPTEMSLATVRAYVWKRPEDLALHYRTVV